MNRAKFPPVQISSIWDLLAASLITASPGASWSLAFKTWKRIFVLSSRGERVHHARMFSTCTRDVEMLAPPEASVWIGTDGVAPTAISPPSESDSVSSTPVSPGAF